MLSSSALAVARATMLVRPHWNWRSRLSCNGLRVRCVNPAALRAGQNRFPGRAKWWPIAAEYRPGLMPQKSTLSLGAMMSGSRAPREARKAAVVGDRVVMWVKGALAA